MEVQSLCLVEMEPTTAVLKTRSVGQTFYAPTALTARFRGNTVPIRIGLVARIYAQVRHDLTSGREIMVLIALSSLQNLLWQQGRGSQNVASTSIVAAWTAFA